jgi:prefoldin subunit 5
MSEDNISEMSLSINETQPKTQAIDKDQITATLEAIEKHLSTLDTKLKEIDTKTDELNKLVANLMKNKSINLDDTCKILSFQIDILSNERTYVQNLKNIFLTRFQKDVYELGEKIMIVATSINTIQFEEEELNRNKTQKKVVPVKKQTTPSLETKSIYSNIDSIFNNLNIIKDTVAYLDTCLEFVNQSVSDHIVSESIANTHSSSLKLKRDYIYVEFKQHYDAFKYRVNYFAELIDSLIKKMKA